MAERGIGTVLQFRMTADAPGRGGSPELLGRAAHAIEELGAVEVVDLVFRPAEGETPAAMSVYFVRAD